MTAVFSMVMPAVPRRTLSVRFGRVVVLFAVSVAVFGGVSVAGMVTAQAPVPTAEYNNQQSAGSGVQPDKTANINSDMTKQHPRGPR
jgi:hypothetical protein